MGTVKQQVEKAVDFWGKIHSTKFPIILFGAGNKGKKALKILQEEGVDPYCFCDNNPELHEKTYCGKPVLSYKVLKERFFHYVILITTSSEFAKEIFCQLKECREVNEIHNFTIPFKVDDVILDYNEVRDNCASYAQVERLFFDEKSRELFREFLAYKMTGNAVNLISREDGDTFFDEILLPRFSHHYVDVGAFTGDTIMKFCQFSQGNYRRIDAFELDKGNCRKLSLFMKYARLSNCYFHNIGVWNCKDSVPYYTLEGEFDIGFENPNLFYDVEGKLDYDFRGEIEKAVIRPTKDTASVDSLDNILAGTMPTLMKINALAADLAVVQGGRKLIEQAMPSLIIDFGTRPDHIIQIPLTLLEYNSNYNLFLRQKSIFSDSKTVLFAIPKVA